VLGPCGHDRIDDLRETFHLFFHSSTGKIHTAANIGGCLRASGENLGYSSRIVDAGPRLVQRSADNVLLVKSLLDDQSMVIIRGSGSGDWHTFGMA
jgi:hypothetical protein